MPKPPPPQAKRALLKLLRQIRLEAGLRQEELADRLDQPQPFVSRVETGERRLDVLELREYCDSCGIALEEFARRLEQQLNEESLEIGG